MPSRLVLILMLIILAGAPGAEATAARAAGAAGVPAAGAVGVPAAGAVGVPAAGAFAVQVASEPGPAAAGRPSRTSYRWPLDGRPVVVRRFTPPPRPWLAGHRGVDLAGPLETVVRAAGPGVVLFAGQVAGRGVISIRHADGLQTTYEPVIARVRAGAAVAAGDAIGVLAPGHAGCPVSRCLHWGLRRGEVYFDPLALLGLVRVRLLPVAGLPVPMAGHLLFVDADPLPIGSHPRISGRPVR